MSTLNIAIVGGVVLLILVLTKMRRSNAADPTPSTRGRTRGERRRKRGKDAPPAPPEPMPLAAAAGQAAAATAPGPLGPPAAEWPPVDDPAPDQWPPVTEASPVEWPPVEDHPVAREDPAPAQDPSPAIDSSSGHDPLASGGDGASWADDELVTDPGWPMPGEVDVAWSPPAGQEPIGMAPPVMQPVAAEPSWSDEAAATAAPPRVEWLSGDPADDEAPVWAPMETAPEPEPESVWAPSPEASEASEEVFAWGAPAEPAPADAPPAWEPVEHGPEPASSWDAEAEDLYDSQPTGPIPVVRIPDEAAAEQEYAPEAGYAAAMEQYAPEIAYAPGAEYGAAPGYAYPPGSLDAPGVEIAVEETVVDPEPYAAYLDDEVPSAPSPVAEATPVAEPVAIAEEPVAFEEPVSVAEPVRFDEPIAFDEALVVDPPAAHDAQAAIEEPAPEVSGPAVAWWDEAPAEPVVVARAPKEDDPAFTGRFALGGFAMQPGQHSLGGVAFRVDLERAPTAWAVATSLDEDVPAGTLVLVLDGSINCAAEGLEVVMEPGFAPTTQGFTVRAAALAAGPFAASGTFRVL